MSNKYFVGIDTSAYTTSIGVIDEKDNIIVDLRELLKVKKGSKGLRQQEAIFQHMKNLPILIENMVTQIDVSKIDTIACSSKPRNIKCSYMPVFTVGREQAFIISKILDVRYKEYSHQQGHIVSGIMNNKLKEYGKFLSFHISGGTSEFLLVNNKKNGIKNEIIGGTLDISIGQLIDRIGIELDLSFPSGRKMDEISQKGKIIDLNIPISIKDNTWFNLSGMENYFKNLINNHLYNIEDILATLFYTISLFLYTSIINGCAKYDVENVLLTGGVSANKIIRQCLRDKFNKSKEFVFFPKIELCTDNGIGIAYLGKEK